ncbi:hypothetical protein [Picrophilus oshimae]|uniref:hypothetical protein n=1 Tax=Picrophilus oshimae TaxID=46632 RepID=UPI0009FC5249|nr:hypothetical protein [Picrophilus oshimae]
MIKLAMIESRIAAINTEMLETSEAIKNEIIRASGLIAMARLNDIDIDKELEEKIKYYFDKYLKKL